MAPHTGKWGQIDVPKFEYDQLAEDNSEIRVLHILPGVSEDPIHIHLSTIAFDAEIEDKLSYEALSYTWGSAEDPVQIFIKCEDGLRTLAVTQNCHEALCNLRHSDKSRTLWIDALCINQTDLKERGRQVSIMRSIYAKAAWVIVWLGGSANESDQAIRWINSIDRRIKYKRHDHVLVSLDADSSLVTSEQPAASAMELEAFIALMERPYFDRLWVWQEVRMGGDATKVRCGSQETTFRALMTAVNYSWTKVTDNTPTALRLYPRLSFIKSLPLVDVVDGLTALDKLRKCQCTDQRDRIYTALSFGDTYRALPMTPNYKCSTESVYIDFILRYLKVAGKDLRFLSHIGDCVPPIDMAERMNLPSWTPDWSQQRITEPLWSSFCSGSSPTSLKSANSVQLTVQGLRVGTVQNTAMFGRNVSARALYLSISRTVQRLVPSGIDDDFARRLVRVLTSSTCAEHFVPAPESYAKREQCLRYLKQVLREDDLSSEDPKATSATLIKGNELIVAQRHFHFCQQRSLFTSIGGDVGLGPEQMRDGDMLALLLGSKYAMVLRPSGVDQDCYRVVGNALCTHVIDAEPLLGELPGEYECVQVLDESTGSYSPAFENKSDGSVTYEDPRLPTLPPQWEALSETTSAGFNAGESPLAYRNNLTQEVLDYRRDPRMTADALKKRGVNIEIFKLV